MVHDILPEFGGYDTAVPSEIDVGGVDAAGAMVSVDREHTFEKEAVKALEVGEHGPHLGRQFFKKVKGTGASYSKEYEAAKAPAATVELVGEMFEAESERFAGGQDIANGEDTVGRWGDFLVAHLEPEYLVLFYDPLT